MYYGTIILRKMIKEQVKIPGGLEVVVPVKTNHIRINYPSCQGPTKARHIHNVYP